MTFIFLFGNCQNSFSRGPLFGPFWSVKYFPFEQKLPIRTVHHIFLESRHPEVTKNWYYLCPPRGAKKKRYQLTDHKSYGWNFQKWEKIGRKSIVSPLPLPSMGEHFSYKSFAWRNKRFWANWWGDVLYGDWWSDHAREGGVKR